VKSVNSKLTLSAFVVFYAPACAVLCIEARATRNVVAVVSVSNGYRDAVKICGTVYGFVAEELNVTLSLRGRIVNLRKRTGIGSSLALLIVENALLSKRT
jgi:hypothetical protein